MRKEHGKQSITHLATLLLLGVFAMFLVLVLMQGAGAYQRLTERDAMAYEKRTALQYLTTKMRQISGESEVLVADFGQGNSLVILEEILGEKYQTQIYCYDGWLMELFTAEGEEAHPEDGERLLAAQGLKLWMEENLLWIELQDSSGNEETLTLYLRGRGDL